MILLLLALLNLNLVEAFEVVKESGKLILRGDCSGISKEFSQFQKWTEKTGRSCQNQSVTNTSGVCSIDIDECVPEHVKKYFGATPTLHGPNCWNLALVMAGLVPQLRFSSPWEMSFFMAEPFCKARKNSESRQAGDIGAIRYYSAEDGGLMETHGFVYISENLVYTKNGPSADAPFQIQNASEMFNRYNMKNAPEECKNNEKNSDCFDGVEYFHCSEENLDDVYAQASTKQTEALDVLNSLEACVSGLIFTNGVVDEVAASLIKFTIPVLLRQLEDLLKEPEEGSNELVSKAIKTRLVSLSYSFDSKDERVSALKQAFQDSLQRLDPEYYEQSVEYKN